MKRLTPAQEDVLKALREVLDESGFEPTHAQIAARVEITKNSLAGHLRALERAGAIARTIRLLDADHRWKTRRRLHDSRDAKSLHLRSPG